MSKELTPLKALQNLTEYLTGSHRNCFKELSIIENALKEYEGAKNHIEALNKERVENSIKLKALEIIKEKNVNVRAFKKTFLMKQNDDVKLRVYNSQNDKDEDDLTQAEFDLLKGIILNDLHK